MILEVKSICLKRNKKLLFKDLSLNLNKSQILILKGSNGVGKSSLLEAIVGMLELSAGEIKINGKSNLQSDNRFTYIGHNNSLKEELTVIENLRLWIKLNNQTFEDMEIIQKLSFFKINHLFDHQINLLSAGQKKKVALSKLLFSNCKLWILDEPINSLDKDSRNQFNLLIEQQKKRNGSILITTHLDLGLKSLIKIDLDLLKKKGVTNINPNNWNNL